MGRLFSAMASVAAVLLLAACSGPGPCYPSQPPLGPRPTAAPNPGPADAPDGETPEQAVRRFFPEVLSEELAAWHPEHLFDGARPGKALPISRDYDSLAQWVLPNDSAAVRGKLFPAMWPLAMKKRTFLATIVNDRETLCEYRVRRDGRRWERCESVMREGEVWQLDQALADLRDALGDDATVRVAVFVPSGYVFAVGRSRGQELAALVGYAVGPGVDVEADLEWPESPKVLTPAQLRGLLTP